jgi:hypothetical protein
MLVRFQPRQRGKLPLPNTPDGETGSCLSYKEMLRVQFLLGRPSPRCITSSAPVSDTGCLGANPGEAAILICDFRLMIDDLKTISAKNKHHLKFVAADVRRL